MKKVVLSVALVLGLGLTQARAQMEEVMANAESKKEQSVVGKIIDDLKESTRTVHENNKANFSAEKEAFREMYAKAIEPDPNFVKFRQTKGIKNKMRFLAENFKEDYKEISIKEKERREQFNDSYKTLLEDQRTKREELVKSRYII